MRKGDDRTGVFWNLQGPGKSYWRYADVTAFEMHFLRFLPGMT
jgi:hypothetical protein